MPRIPALEAVTESEPRTMRVPWLTFFRDLVANVAASTQVLPDGVVRLTGQTAAIGTTTIPTGTLVAGLYRLAWYGQVITPAGVSSDFQVTVTWTNNGVTQTKTGTLRNGNLTTTYDADGIDLFHLDAGTPVSYAVSYNSNPAAAMELDLYIALQLVAADQ